MLFTSYGFLAFIAILFVLYYAVPGRFQVPLLLAASYLFYLIARPTALIYMIATTVTIWFTALSIDLHAQEQKAWLKEHKDDLSADEKKLYKEAQKKIRTRRLVICLLINLGILAVVKYTNFAISNLNGIIGAFGGTGSLSFVSIAMPLGISFYTFRAIGYLIDVYRGAYPAEKSLVRFALFVSFFPQIIQGPISRYDRLSPSLFEEHRFDSRTVSFGLQRMLWGYFKKLVVADRILAAVSTVVGDPQTYKGAYVLAALLFYTIQLYADFTGGIDITIGIAEVMGITVEENFIRPYFSTSLKEYWRRWHITMCSWFRDYLFYPVSTSRWMSRFTKFTKARFGNKAGKRIPVYVSSFIVWLATGIWHGASWNFIVWGLLNWAVLMVSEELEPLYARFHERFGLKEKAGYKVFMMLRTFCLICVLNLFDCYQHVGDTLRSLASILTAGNWAILTDGSLNAIGPSRLDYGIVAAGCLLMLLVSIYQERCGSLREKIHERPLALRFAIWYGLFLLVLLLGAYGIGYDASQFIYNQF